MEIKCSHCGYEWITASEKLNVSCPSCLNKTKNNSEIKISQEREDGK